MRRISLAVACACLLVVTVASAQSAKEQSKAAPSAVKASTGTKPSPVGQPASDYKPPAAKSLKTKEPPSPRTK